MGKKILASVSFWGLILFGPVLLALWNSLSFNAMRQGELLYLIFIISGQAISATAACFAARHILRDVGKNSVVQANAYIAILLMLVQALASINAGGDTMGVISDGLTIAALVFFGILGKSIE